MQRAARRLRTGGAREPRRAGQVGGVSYNAQWDCARAAP